jgi:hypothetical protein
MAAVTDLPAASCRYSPVWIASALLLLMFLGLTLAAVVAIKVDCENDYLTWDGTTTPLTADDNHTRLLAGTQYWLAIGGVRVALPSWTPPMLSEFGLLPTECR